MINKKLRRCIKKWDYINEYLIKVELEIKSKKVVIIGVYAPIDNASDQEKTTFYNQLTTLLDEIGNRKELFI